MHVILCINLMLYQLLFSNMGVETTNLVFLRGQSNTNILYWLCQTCTHMISSVNIERGCQRLNIYNDGRDGEKWNGRKGRIPRNNKRIVVTYDPPVHQRRRAQLRRVAARRVLAIGSHGCTPRRRHTSTCCAAAVSS